MDSVTQILELIDLGFWEWSCEKRSYLVWSDWQSEVFGHSIFEMNKYENGLAAKVDFVSKDDWLTVYNDYDLVLHGQKTKLQYSVSSRNNNLRILEALSPVFGANGEVIGVRGVAMDITNQYNSELRLRRYEESSKLEADASRIVHDLNNILAVVAGNIELAQEETSLDEIRKLQNAALIGTNEGKELAKDILGISPARQLHIEAVCLQGAFDFLGAMFSGSVFEKVEIHIDVPEHLPKIRSDKKHLQNALLNLCINARDALPRGGKISISARGKLLESDFLLKDYLEGLRLSEGDFLYVSISDNGIGIDPRDHAKIFDPFFTTKRNGQGTGLGLSIVKSFVDQSGAHMLLDSQPAIGTVVHLAFPLDRSVAPVADTDTPEVSNDSLVGMRCLLVEDEAALRKIIEKMISSFGVAVVSAQSGDAAMGIIENDKEFDFVLTDIVMPGKLQGTDLAKTIKTQTEIETVIFMSGFPMTNIQEFEPLIASCKFISKPMKKSELRDCILEAKHGKGSDS